jgi:hypothetical protein
MWRDCGGAVTGISFLAVANDSVLHSRAGQDTLPTKSSPFQVGPKQRFIGIEDPRKSDLHK